MHTTHTTIDLGPEAVALRSRLRTVFKDAEAECTRAVNQYGRTDYPDLEIPPFAVDSLIHPQLAKDACAALHIPPPHEFRVVVEWLKKNGGISWAPLLAEEMSEAFEAIGNDGALRGELLQVMAMTALWITEIDRRNARTV